MENARYCFTCDLKNDAQLISEYKAYHSKVWPEVLKSIRDSDIANMEIYLHGNRLFMIMEVGKDFDLEKKARLDAENPKVQEWEDLMWNYQQALPTAEKGQKWVPMERIFHL